MPRKPPYVTAPVDKTPVKLLIFAKDFFFVPMKKVKIETCPVADRTYFIVDGRIMAVGERTA